MTATGRITGNGFRARAASTIVERLVAFDRRARRVRRRPGLWLGIGALLLAVQISPWWYAASDGALYLSMARGFIAPENLAPSLGNGTPPGYPLLISPVFLLGDRPFLALSVWHWFFAVALLIGVYGWAGRVCPRAAVWIALLTVLNMGVCYYYRRTLKELAFLTAAVWTANAMNAVICSRTRGELVRWLIAAGALLCGTLLIRYSAVALVLGFGLAVVPGSRSVLNLRGRRRAAWSAGLLAALSATVLGVVLVGHGDQYLQPFGWIGADLASSLVEGLRLRIGSVTRICVPGMFKAYAGAGRWLDWNILLGALLVLAVLVGWRRAARSVRDPLMLTLPVYVGLYIVWPFDQGARFLVPMVPVLTVCFWHAVDGLPRIRHLLCASCLAAHAAASLGYWLVIDAPRAAAWHDEWTALEEVVEEIDLTQGPVACPGLPNELQCMLAVCLNDPSAVLSEERGLNPERAAWAIRPDGAPVPAGWCRVERVGAYCLLRSERLGRATATGLVSKRG